MNCKGFEEGLTTLAEGGEDPIAATHAATCADCEATLAKLARIVAAARLGQAQAPDDLVARACELMPPRPRLVARLLGNGLANSGARRGEAQEFALHVGVEGFSVRLHYTALPGGWEVMGRAPTADWNLAHAGGVAPCGASGRFRLLAPALDRTSFVLSKDGLEIEVPSARELLDDAA